MSIPRVAAIHDLSGYGRCSLTTALPILSALGVQCCPLPTAFLSAHTGIEGFTFLDLTDEMERTTAHWASLRLTFRSVYSGFLGSAEQVRVVERFLETFRGPDTRVIVDPVMGDHGEPYRTCTPELCREMARLAERADVIVPNLTEAALLLNTPYEALPAGEQGCRELAHALSQNGQRSVVLTGAAFGPAETGAVYYDAETGTCRGVRTKRIPREFSGTGDVFASVLTGVLTRGGTLETATERAVEFVCSCVERTAGQNLPAREGVEFEPLLGLLTEHR